MPTPALVEEAQREIARLKKVQEEAKGAGPMIKRLEALVNAYEGTTVPLPSNGNGRRPRRPSWQQVPANCVLPARMHKPGVSRGACRYCS